MGDHINHLKWGAWASVFELFSEVGGWHEDAIISFQDGVIYAGNQAMKDKMDADDLEELAALNWLWDDKYDCWVRYT